jgi:hypothetical protein
MPTHRSVACLGTPGRTIYLLLGGGLTAFALVEMIRYGGATWFALAFFILPDVALIYGADRTLAPGQLHPRAVRFYNIVHSFWIPVVLMLAGLWLPPLVFTAGAAWAAHIAWDRGLGFGLRTRKGYQQLPACPRA